MPWADLRGLSSSTPKVTRMNTAVTTRRQLPLPLPLLRAPSSPSPPCPKSHGQSRRFSATAAQLRKDKRRGDNKKWLRKEKHPSLFAKIFPDEDLLAFPYRRRQQQLCAPTDAATAANTTTTTVPEKHKVKPRYLTSLVDKSEATDYKIFKLRKEAERAERAERAGNRKEELGKIASLLERWPLPRTKGKEQTGGAMDKEGGGGGGASLFEELFQEKPATDMERDKKRSQALEDSPLNHDDLQAWIDSLPRVDEDGIGCQIGEKARPAMLILSDASANLLESDFYRIGPQGQHLDGWSASIRKVMQAYDYNTLEPMGRYFILFDSHTAAVGYQEEAQRRHLLAYRALQSPGKALVPPPSQPRPAWEGFTLAVPSTPPLSLHLYKLNRATEARLENFRVQSLLGMTPDQPPRAGSEVILSLEGGTLDNSTLSQWIRRDARDRNLGWPVYHIRPYFPPNFDRRRALMDEEQPDGVADGQAGLWDGRNKGDYNDDDDAAPALVDSEEQRVDRGPVNEKTRAALFILSFPDAHEARRFVRAWHRKELARPRGQTLTVSTYFVW